MSAPSHRILRFFSSSSDGASTPVAKTTALSGASASKPALSAVDRANERLLAEITEFLTSAKLAVTSHNLLIAHAAFSGDDPQLARVIGQRRLSGQAITQEWLDEQTRGDDKESTIRTLISQLEDSLDRFATTAKNARTSTASCNAELARQVDAVTQMPETLRLDDVLGLAHTILDHTRKLEADIRASEVETGTLRESLARAQRDAEIDQSDRSAQPPRL